MATAEAQKRSEKAQGLKTWQVDDTWFYVESEDGKIAYKCCVSDAGDCCNCGDFASRSKNDPSFKCKHLLAVMNSIPRNQVMEAQFLEKRKPRLDESFIKQIDDKDFALYGGLLDLAHQKNLCLVDVNIIQFPSDENKNTAICKAVVQTLDGKKFSDVGDANPMNCNSKVAKHLIRMASTRAKARAFRDMDNIGMTCLEELGDITDVITGGNESRAAQSRKDNVRKFVGKQKAAVDNNAGTVISDAGKTAPELENQTEVKSPESPSATAGNTEASSESKSVKTRQTTKSGNGNGNGKAKSDKIPMMSEAQKNAIFNLSRRRNISVEELENLATKTFNMTLESLSSADASMFIRTLQQAS
ncbi:MAG: hypothetical protein WC405_09095 [Syntrophales bacterium]